jgi:flagellar hook protein FlgE
MPFQVALSGLNAASSDLSVTAHNIANVNTTGFKGSRAEFADVYAVSGFGLGDTAIGSGVRLAGVQQQFGQGTVNFTDSALDLALNGEGFFILSDNGSLEYTRAGAFGADRDGYVVSSAGKRLQVYPPLSGGGFNTGALSDLLLSSSDSPPIATTTVGAGVNLPANAAVPATALFDPADPSSYNHTTSLTIYDSLGSPLVASLYFVKTAAANAWEMRTYVNGGAVGGAQPVAYDSSGNLVTPAAGTLTLPAFNPGTGAANVTLTVDLARSSQYGATFNVNSLTQDGYTTGRLTGIEVTGEGVVQARYTNGQSIPLGLVALANFSNTQGLQQLGETAWGETFASGQALRGQAGGANFGVIQSGALESSNVDLTEQLVKMITAQRNFQANAQMIQTADAITQTIINIR